jgi:outer membrane protein TolC
MFVALISLPAMAHAATALSWERCVAEVTDNNVEMKAARNSVQSSEYLIQSAGSGYYPQVSGNLAYSYGNSTLSSGSSSLDSSNSSATGTYSASLALTQNLFAGFQDKARVEQATANTTVSRAALESTKARVSFDLKAAFQNLFYAQNYIKLTQDILHRREENLRLVALRFQSGRENKGSVLLSQAYLAQAQLDELQAKDAMDLSRAQLAKVLGRDRDEEIVVTGNVPVQEPDAQLDLKALAVQTPDHLQAVAQEAAAQASLQLARSPLYPSLNLTGQYARQGTDFFPENDRWAVGMNLSIPIYSGGKDYYNSQSAALLSAAAGYNRETIDRQLLAKLKQSYNAYLEAVQRLKVDEAFYLAATTRAQVAREKYNNGLLSFEDWDVIENDLVLREKNRLQSVRDRVIAEAAWEQVLGKGVIR